VRSFAANTHREGISLYDNLQPAHAALYSARCIRTWKAMRSSARGRPHIEVKPATGGGTRSSETIARYMR
jgi:hypothetical protein